MSVWAKCTNVIPPDWRTVDKVLTLDEKQEAQYQRFKRPTAANNGAGTSEKTLDRLEALFSSQQPICIRFQDDRAWMLLDDSTLVSFHIEADHCQIELADRIISTTGKIHRATFGSGGLSVCLSKGGGKGRERGGPQLILLSNRKNPKISLRDLRRTTSSTVHTTDLEDVEWSSLHVNSDETMLMVCQPRGFRIYALTSERGGGIRLNEPYVTEFSSKKRRVMCRMSQCDPHLLYVIKSLAGKVKLVRWSYYPEQNRWISQKDRSDVIPIKGSILKAECTADDAILFVHSGGVSIYNTRNGHMQDANFVKTGDEIESLACSASGLVAFSTDKHLFITDPNLKLLTLRPINTTLLDHSRICPTLQSPLLLQWSSVSNPSQSRPPPHLLLFSRGGPLAILRFHLGCTPEEMSGGCMLPLSRQYVNEERFDDGLALVHRESDTERRFSLFLFLFDCLLKLVLQCTANGREVEDILQVVRRLLETCEEDYDVKKVKAADLYVCHRRHLHVLLRGEHYHQAFEIADRIDDYDTWLDLKTAILRTGWEDELCHDIVRRCQDKIETHADRPSIDPAVREFEGKRVVGVDQIAWYLNVLREAHEQGEVLQALDAQRLGLYLESEGLLEQAMDLYEFYQMLPQIERLNGLSGVLRSFAKDIDGAVQTIVDRIEDILDDR
ncbi:hypothetical protein PROFUN_04041 [Planoprotostelium fungivorum]|uniref:Uncharacterized protein n=1 Tax=Planoprotostelium fungivorum TaxID=1890364 RepID=A0A2P6NWF7_9EUKA|nr:hypothetical protein PROFUN_04041 [Planoprotostelium fungivorum]